jgi:hypothetical protein
MAEQEDSQQPDEIVSEYANNTTLEQTVWDLKLIFGEFSQRSNSIEWHTSITMPWAQAKLLAYYLQLNVEAWELRNGPIKIPDTMIPEAPPILPEQEQDPAQRAVFELISARRQALIEKLREESQR